MSVSASHIRHLVAAAAVLGSATVAAWTPYGYGPNAPYYPPTNAPSGFGGDSELPQISRRATEDAYIIEIWLNGMKADDVQVSRRGNWISVERAQSRADVREENFEQGGGFSHSYSFSGGSANRHFSVPRDADVGAMTREEGEGVLRIQIPRLRY